ncbi:MAG: hypothetical protein IT445_18650 [Phycisphaeraceae bacterium]|nr:hypothetical protein [Phycisphaeraceae bacterium]
MTPVQILGEIGAVEVIASGRSVHARQWLRRRFGPGRWRKMKGIATVELVGGRIVRAELHWYEAHGHGRHMMKIKRMIE